MIKHTILIAVLLMSGCSTMAHVEGTGEVGKVLRVVESTQCRLGTDPCNYGNGRAPQINRTLGELKSLRDQPSKYESIPYIVQHLGAIF